MSGTLLYAPPVAVDLWGRRRTRGARAFFLTHLHADHTAGLTRNWRRPLHCSPLTGRLLRLRLQVDACWIRPLEVGQSHAVALDERGRRTMTVTPIDAHHCPGSVMFLFEGDFGVVLYTGDFRYTPAMLKEPVLMNQKQIDVLYLDNTNCDPALVLPSREQATEQIKELIKAHPKYQVKIGIYTLGKESLLTELSLKFNTWIVVSPERLTVLELLDKHHPFTTWEDSGWIHVVEPSEIHWKTLCYWNQQRPTIAILPTGRPLKKTHPNMHIIPYSDHSSFSELCEFVQWLKPCSIIPIVKSHACQAYLEKYLNPNCEVFPVPSIPELWQDVTPLTNSRREERFRQLLKMTVPTRQPGPRGVIFKSLKECPDTSKSSGAVQNHKLKTSGDMEVYQQNSEPIGRSAAGCLGDCICYPWCCTERKEMEETCSSDGAQGQLLSAQSPTSAPAKEQLVRRLGSRVKEGKSGLVESHGSPLFKNTETEGIWLNKEPDAPLCRDTPCPRRRVYYAPLQFVPAQKADTPSCEQSSSSSKGEEFLPLEAAGDSSSLPSLSLVSSKQVTHSLAEEYSLVPLNTLKQYSAQSFYQLVEKYFRRGEGP
ncbi:PREDICTED: 5' exonuclease Apollo [Crocodylus porosus]|uniref:5' exonuclease Apollo n=1 Tax=Crocodylus porosus TaxID=8502 RepID=UPI00093E0CC1|nr:PREDICTED: 5' exonuclease Apollo [Crocodylus porosus]